MQASAIDRFGGSEVLTLHKAPVPEIDTGEVLIAIHTAGVGKWDAEMRDGWYPGGHPAFPQIPGTDGFRQGRIGRGSRVRRLEVGEAVYAYSFANPKGGFCAEYVAVAAEKVAPIPAGLTMLKGEARRERRDPGRFGRRGNMGRPVRKIARGSIAGGGIGRGRDRAGAPTMPSTAAWAISPPYRKSGTNIYHGSAFWYHQNRALDATAYGSVVKPQKVANDFGFSLGGPVRIPKLYNGVVSAEANPIVKDPFNNSPQSVFDAIQSFGGSQYRIQHRSRLFYIGRRSIHLPYAPNLNQSYYSTQYFAQQPLQARPFPYWGRIESRDTGGTATYHSFQAELNHRYSSGLAYTPLIHLWPLPNGFGGETKRWRQSRDGFAQPRRIARKRLRHPPPALHQHRGLRFAVRESQPFPGRLADRSQSCCCRPVR